MLLNDRYTKLHKHNSSSTQHSAAHSFSSLPPLSSRSSPLLPNKEGAEVAQSTDIAEATVSRLAGPPETAERTSKPVVATTFSSSKGMNDPFLRGAEEEVAQEEGPLLASFLHMTKFTKPQEEFWYTAALDLPSTNTAHKA